MAPLRLRDGTAWKGAKILVLSPTPTHPQDYGNRKRIFNVCMRLKERGAQIVFLHYPSEQEWRARIPTAAEAEMRTTWDRYYLLPVCRPLHTAPNGAHHTIDEWWDDAIGNFLRWMFSVESFDAFIVNYTWLSKALDSAPPGVVKILDTHDRFAGRKELLVEHGLEPEYFYTTAAGEAAALSRADIVWAIKDQERLEFQRMVKEPVLTLLHLDDTPVLPAPAPDNEGYLRVGIIGARNNVNLTNLNAFMKDAIPLLERYFAPVKIVVAGSVCDELRNTDPRFVTLMRDVPDVKDFYSAIDVACVPMAFSTGLKIKVGEAISLGVPLISHAHAFEGYPAHHPFHTLGSFREIAEKLVEVAFDRSLLQYLRAASLRMRYAVSRSIDECMEDTWSLVQQNRRLVLYCVDAGALVPEGAMREVMDSAIRYMKLASDVAIAVVAGCVEKLAGRSSALKTCMRIAIAAELVKDEPLAAKLAANGFEIVSFPDLVARLAPDVVVADAVAPFMAEAAFPKGTLVYRAEMIAQSATSDPDTAWIDGRFRRLIAVGVSRSRSLEMLAHRLRAELFTVPCLWRSERVRDCIGDRAQDPRFVAILGADNLVGSAALCGLLVDLGARPVLVGLSDGGTDPPARMRRISARRFAEELFDPNRALPQLVVDVSFGALGLQLARELVQRIDIPLVTAEWRLDQPALTGAPPGGRVATAPALFQQIVTGLASTGRAADRSARELESDAGWTSLWRYLSLRRKGQLEEFI